MEERAQSAPVPFGKYLLDAELARGGMSRVFAARLRGPGGFEKRLVVKQILPELARRPGFVDLFVREANTLVQMGHAHIVPVYELGVVDGVYFLAMEQIEGSSVAEMLREGPLPEALVAHLAVQTCEALGYAHDRFGLVHRDVTPRNVLVDAEGNARLVDFGIAAPVERTGHGERFGSPGYMSPEQTRGETLGPRSDLFSLGTVLYEALTGERAIGRTSQTSGVDDAPRTLGPEHGVAEPVRRVVNRMLALDPDERPVGAAAIATELRAWLARAHPEGVAGALGRRAESARRSPASPQPTAATGVTATTGLAKSIATSAALDALIEQSTERITPDPDADDDREGTEPLARAKAAPGDEAGRTTPVTEAGRTTPVTEAGRTTPVTEAVGAAAEAGASTPGADMPPPRAQDAGGPARAARTLAALTAVAAVGAMAWLAVALPVTSGPPAERAGGSIPRPPPKAAAEGPEAPAPAAALEGSETPAQELPRGADPDGRTRGAIAPAADTPRTAAASARLSVSALPWAEVSVDGKSLGTTPQRDVTLSAGRHRLRAVCPPLGREAVTALQLAAGERAHLLIDLNQDPPVITRR